MMKSEVRSQKSEVRTIIRRGHVCQVLCAQSRIFLSFTRYFMKKALFALIPALLFASCKFWNEPIEEFFSYWSAEAYVTGSDVKVPAQRDSSGVTSIASGADADILLSASNPKSFRFIMPTAGNSEMIKFTGLSAQPVPGTDYSLTQVSSDTLKLTYKSAFLKTHEWGTADLGTELTLYADDGRKFVKPYVFNLKANTPPPTPTFVLAKTTSSGKYVLCLQVPDMNVSCSGGTLHQDIAKISIDGTEYDLKVNGTKDDFVKPDTAKFIGNTAVEQLTGSPAVPSGKWILYYETEVPVGGASRKYQVFLTDEMGLVSGTLETSTALNEAPAANINVKKGESVASTDPLIGTSNGNPILIKEEISIHGAEIEISNVAGTTHCTVTENGTQKSYEGTSVIVQLALNEENEKLYELEYYTDGEGYKPSAHKTVYYKVLKRHTVTFNAKEGMYADGANIYTVNAAHTLPVTKPATSNSPTRQGYTFGGWYKNADCSDGQKWDFATDTVTSNITLYAKWTAGSGIGYEVAHYRQKIANDDYEYYDTDVLYGTTGATIDAGTIKKNYEGFDYHHMYPVSPTIAADSSTVVNLYYNRKTYKVYFSVNGSGGNISATAVTGGTVTGSSVTVKYGGSVTFTAVPDPGYAVDSWSSNVGDISTDKTTATLSHVTADTVKTVTVKFKKVYTVKFKVVDNQGGYLSGSYGGHTQIANWENDGSEQRFTNVSNGSTVRFAASPLGSIPRAWEVEGWTCNGSPVNGISENYDLNNVTDNTTVTVKFKKTTTVKGSDNLAWTLLKKVVEIADPGSTITIDGKIEATGGENAGQIEINKNLTIKGETGAGTDILDAKKMSRIFKVESGKTLTLENLTLTGGNAEGTQDVDKYGGAIYASGATVNITNCTFKGNEAAYGGGAIYARKEGSTASDITISGGTIGGDTDEDKNKVTSQWQFGGGILVETGCTLTLNSVRIIGNEAWRAGGVRANTSTVNMTNCTIKNNKTTGDDDSGGGGVYTFMGTLTMTGCTITGNKADTNGGGLNVEGTTTNITNCTFTGNTAKNGGGIYTKKEGDTPPNVTISGGTIGGTGSTDANKATGTGSDGNGGGIYVGADCKVTLQNNGSTGCTIAGNTAQRGGGVYVNGDTFTMSGNAKITVDNDVYLESGKTITVDGSLSKNPAARITVPNGKYQTTTKVLDGSAVGSEHAKFAVTPKGSEHWTVESGGYLTNNKTDIFNNITRDQIEAAIKAADPSMIYDDWRNPITNRKAKLTNKLVLYKTAQSHYGIMYVTEVDYTSHSGKGHIKFNSKTFNQYGGVLKEETDKVLTGDESFQFEAGKDPGSNLDFTFGNGSTDEEKTFKPLNGAKFYILPN